MARIDGGEMLVRVLVRHGVREVMVGTPKPAATAGGDEVQLPYYADLEPD